MRLPVLYKTGTLSNEAPRPRSLLLLYSAGGYISNHILRVLQHFSGNPHRRRGFAILIGRGAGDPLKLKTDTDLGEGELHGKAVFEDGCYTVQLMPGESTLVYRGDDEPDARFVPEEGNPAEEHFWGVKKIRRF